jgi:mono/diheme cytochrome c family protein/glucose/arabinose dehydrogenase
VLHGPLLLALACAAPHAAQQGDVPGEEQPALPAELALPPAPVLAPDEERASFLLPDGFSIELVASEPLLGDPVQAVFDADGRLWVCEMRGFMPDVEGKGEDAPVGAIAVLADQDGDGRLDTRTVFLDELVLPRAVAPCEDGALVIAPPELLFARDTDGDGCADERETLATGLEGITSPEHAINGLDFGLDNWYRCANAPLSWRRVRGEWTSRRTAGGGQWGIAHDDRGRAFYNTNQDPLRADLFPSHYAVRNPNLGPAAGVNVRVADDFSVWPARPTPGVNRGYRAGILRPGGRLAEFTAACAPFVYRGALLPGLRGDALVCEPAGNLVKRYRLEEDGLFLRATSVHERTDFLCSTDERFRPVNLLGGPDGALYVVDMYRGLIQHRIFVTSFLREQVLERGLAAPTGLGRIWRIVPAGTVARATVPALAGASWTELVAALAHEDGWVRDTARRLIVEQGGGSNEARALLREAALEGGELGRVHALWALEGIGGLDPELLARVVAGGGEPALAAVRLAEPWLESSQLVFARVVAAGRKGPARLRHQVLLSLGEARGEAAETALVELLALDASAEELRTAALSGLHQRELPFLGRLLARPEWRSPAPGRERVLELLARCVAREARSDRMSGLLARIAACREPWQRAALVTGLRAARTASKAGEPDPIRLEREPAELAALAALPDGAELLAALSWPGKTGASEPETPPLAEEEQARFARGRELYAQGCASCHLASGLGEPGKGPPLRGSPWVLESEDTLARILLHGLEGPLELFGERWSAEMPALVAGDGDLAAVMTYVRREWGHRAGPVAPAKVARIRAETSTRTRPWTVDELELLAGR